MERIKNIFRNRLVTVCFHIMAWLCVFLFPFLFFRVQIFDKAFYTREAINMLFMVGIFYLNMYVLIPRFLALKKFAKYISSVILLIFIILIQQSIVDYLFFGAQNIRPRLIAAPEEADLYYINPKSMKFPRGTRRAWEDSAGRPVVFIRHHGRPPFETEFSNKDLSKASAYRDFATGEPMPEHRSGKVVKFYKTQPANDSSFAALTLATTTPGNVAMRTLPLFGRPPLFIGNGFMHRVFWPDVFRRTLMFTLLIFFMSGFIKIVLEWFKSEKQREALKVANLNAELKFLKSQVNPHFLFNSLNSIYSLAHKGSPETEHALVKLSSIMRYMIYHANEPHVLLEKELLYLQDYISIQRLRVSKDVPIQYSLEGEAGQLRIEPMLLIPFVENAFKHGISYTDTSFIDIQIRIEQNTVYMRIINSLFKNRVSERGGIGLRNVIKRLEMLYDGQHELNIEEQEHQFIVNLKIHLKDD
ncbi:hypothetical protein COR50_10545 [Chitinophaga caeni]|uniref:Signal transduction histidine kinase internal region domain-containing protein n=1 Tax=Chitinophaga caeni TaxID=2029983 RepID=A0A291QUD4_9BACT|nr:histidine kinase [Chitinophaga caeni]ATL47570.1 hypothetical protein COR50_10545 [Chitinophaga caeni]